MYHYVEFYLMIYFLEVEIQRYIRTNDEEDSQQSVVTILLKEIKYCNDLSPAQYLYFHTNIFERNSRLCVTLTRPNYYTDFKLIWRYCDSSGRKLVIFTAIIDMHAGRVTGKSQFIIKKIFHTVILLIFEQARKALYIGVLK